MSYQGIRQKIKEVIDEESTLIQESYISARSTFNGFPACTITPSETNADWGSTQRDKITFAFIVTVYYPIAGEVVQEEVDLRLEKVIDELMDIFKTRAVLGDACDWVSPAPSAWGQTSNSETPYRFATLLLSCVKHIENV